jgi:lysosomal acid lipase/cholesteryl ester hydrolase
MWCKFLLLVTFFVVCFSANPDAHKDMVTIVRNKGYPIEEHFVQTKDGYILGVFRIPYGRDETQDAIHLHKPVVFLQHGLLDSSYTWVNNLPSQSFAFILADAGYDVWLGNSRGNTFSQRHTTYLKNSDEFWMFSYNEMAKYDIPAMINYVLEFTKHEKLAYVGHSQGTIQMFAAATFDASINDKIAIYGAFAPVAFLEHCESFLLKLLARLNIQTIFTLLGVDEFLPGTNVINRIAPGYCTFNSDLCNDMSMLVFGPSKDINESRLSVYLSQTPADTSVRNMIHWIQAIENGRFAMFDYGSKEENYEHYNNNKPPSYDLSKLTMPIALYIGANDYLADVADVSTLVSLLNPNIIVSQTIIEGFAHMDFVWGIDAYELVYDPFISQIKQYLGSGITSINGTHHQVCMMV